MIGNCFFFLLRKNHSRISFNFYKIDKSRMFWRDCEHEHLLIEGCYIRDRVVYSRQTSINLFTALQLLKREIESNTSTTWWWKKWFRSDLTDHQRIVRSDMRAVLAAAKMSTKAGLKRRLDRAYFELKLRDSFLKNNKIVLTLGFRPA